MNIKEIKNKINILSNINKLTNTLSMISMSKINKYSKYLFYLNLLYKENYIIFNELFEFKKLKNSCCIIITTDKGLCGNINNEIIKKTLNFIKNNKNIDINIIGKKGYEFFKKKKIIIKNFINYNNNPLEILFPKEILKSLRFYKYIYYISACYIKNNIKILKNNIINLNKKNNINFVKINYYFFLNNYFNNSLKYYYNENYYCELKSRMITMKSASDNSNKIIKYMKILKNKIRQFKVTTDMLEIINGNL
uniref:ATP synthase gamma-subunit n=1 Tax=Carsonella ruddii TaxID=114186 RepID=Q93U22_CARRU|nr:ATP synthase gamma-subunit [Candidatus Carsonella ruddii]